MMAMLLLLLLELCCCCCCTGWNTWGTTGSGSGGGASSHSLGTGAGSGGKWAGGALKRTGVCWMAKPGAGAGNKEEKEDQR